MDATYLGSRQWAVGSSGWERFGRVGSCYRSCALKASDERAQHSPDGLTARE